MMPKLRCFPLHQTILFKPCQLWALLLFHGQDTREQSLGLTLLVRLGILALSLHHAFLASLFLSFTVSSPQDKGLVVIPLYKRSWSFMGTLFFIRLKRPQALMFSTLLMSSCKRPISGFVFFSWYLGHAHPMFTLLQRCPLQQSSFSLSFPTQVMVAILESHLLPHLKVFCYRLLSLYFSPKPNISLGFHFLLFQAFRLGPLILLTLNLLAGPLGFAFCWVFGLLLLG